MTFLPTAIPLASQLDNVVIVPGWGRLGKPETTFGWVFFDLEWKVKNLYSAVLSVKVVNLIASH